MKHRARILEGHALAIAGERIAAILPQQMARESYRQAVHVRRDHHALMPGLINAHTHAAMSLLRGVADGLPLHRWLNERIWPLEREYADVEFVRDGSALGMAEMLSAGITCFGDMYFFPNITARIAADLGMRACVGLPIAEFPTRWACDANEYLSKALEVRDELRDLPLIRTQFAPHAPYTVADGTFERLRTLADELDAGIVIHLHESPSEIAASLDRHGVRPIERLESLGILNPSLTAVHMTCANEEDIARAQAAGISVTLCPESNLKLGNGAPPIGAWAAASVPLALGTDGAASNNDLDLWAEAKLAALLGGVSSSGEPVVNAWDALRMLTTGGAAALGLAHEVGTLEVGKLADLCCVDFDQAHMQPVYDVAAQLIFSGGRDAVSDVWVAGRQLIKERRFEQLDWPALRARAQSWREAIDASAMALRVDALAAVS